METGALRKSPKSVIEKSAIIASQYGYQFIGTEHFSLWPVKCAAKQSQSPPIQTWHRYFRPPTEYYQRF